MSRVGAKPVPVPKGVEVRVEGSRVAVKGKLGELSADLPQGITARVDGAEVIVTRSGESRQQRSLHGLSRSLLQNMVRGVVEGYRKDVTIEGVGFRAAAQGRKLSVQVGFSHPVEFVIPEGITVGVEGGGTQISVNGADKQAVGDLAARIRRVFPAEPYKGKGLRFKGEEIRRKVGKTVA